MRSTLSVLILMLAVGSVQAGNKLTQVSYNDGAASVDLFIELSGSGASPELADRWEQMVEKIWNDALAEHGCSCFTIKLNVDFQYRAPSAPPTPGWESWEVQPRESWEQADPNWTPYVELPSSTQENSDRFEGESGSGQLAVDEPWVVVHEVAHLFGHDDKYSFPEGWEKGDSVTPDEGWRGNLMSGAKITEAEWNSGYQKFFSAKNYEEIQQAILDYLQERGELAPRAVMDFEVDVNFHHNAWGPSGPAAGMNSELATGALKLCVLFFEGGSAPTTGAGTLQWQPVSRVPGTFYGGNQTVNAPYPVQAASGRVAYEAGFATYHVTLNPQDIVNYRLTSGEVYATGSHLSYVFQHSLFQNPWVTGTLRSFQISPMAIAFGDSHFPVTITTPANQNVQSVGSGELRVLHSVLLDAPQGR